MDKLICIGKNYHKHVKEMAQISSAPSDSVNPKKPVIFLKPSSVLKQAQNNVAMKARLPRERGSIHYECEIVLRIRVIPGKAPYFDAVTLGLDMTLRDLQSDLKKQGYPWEVGKVFQDAALVGEWRELSTFPDFLTTEFSCEIDGVVRQRAKGEEMTYLPEVCLEYAKTCFPVCDGDLLFTGTPAGVGPVLPGQKANLKWLGHNAYSALEVEWI